MEFSKNYNRDAKVILHIIMTATWQKVLSDKTITKMVGFKRSVFIFDVHRCKNPNSQM